MQFDEMICKSLYLHAIHFPVENEFLINGIIKKVIQDPTKYTASKKHPIRIVHMLECLVGTSINRNGCGEKWYQSWAATQNIDQFKSYFFVFSSIEYWIFWEPTSS